MASNAGRVRSRSPLALALGIAAAGLSWTVPQAAVANTPDKDGWIAIPTRINEIQVRYKPMGCKDNLCTLQVAGLTPNEAISTETIDCKAMKIRNATSPVATGWKTIAPGTVDMQMAQTVCHNLHKH